VVGPCLHCLKVEFEITLVQAHTHTHTHRHTHTHSYTHSCTHLHRYHPRRSSIDSKVSLSGTTTATVLHLQTSAHSCMDLHLSGALLWYTHEHIQAWQRTRINTHRRRTSTTPAAAWTNLEATSKRAAALTAVGHGAASPKTVCCLKRLVQCCLWRTHSRCRKVSLLLPGSLPFLFMLLCFLLTSSFSCPLINSHVQVLFFSFFYLCLICLFPNP